ncbi:DUF2997 domain-containing protein [Roseibacillus ishigakijimensis]|uniref:DUF2997 domain-containing protein n=1 Tax=Roseibacillus ishigakijimensis TaxID=454146 RepID=A0A934RWW2_9BACT|nr:DUF2997 domain-containing protein [Roseibacillus ishigakijimensis]MBK1835635.1 DUF2997 domain-containing protein [Roseibacillus ishigakijimensis]
MSRSIQVTVSPAGEITVEAEGFNGRGCEAATKAIENALGKAKTRTRKPFFWKREQRLHNPQQLGGEG